MSDEKGNKRKPIDLPTEPPETPEDEKPTIDKRIEELKKDGNTPEEMVLVLYKEGYNTVDIMKHHLPLKALKQAKEPEEQVQDVIAGSSKGPGYLDEIKTMVRREISKSRELTEFFYNLGLGVLLASLSKSGVSIDEFRKISLEQSNLQGALQRAGETAFKALEYYRSDLIPVIEKERDEARAYVSVLESKVDQLLNSLDPKLRLEKMIYSLVLAGGVDQKSLDPLIERWLNMEIPTVFTEMK